MTNRERFRAAMKFQETDRPCHAEWGFWGDTIERWRSEGLPKAVEDPSFEYVSPGPDLFLHFGIIKFGYMLPGQYYDPPFRHEVVEETPDYRVERTVNGVLQKVNLKGPSIPQFLDYPVKDRKDYYRVKERLVPDVQRRYPADWDRIVRSVREQDHTLVCTHMDGFFGSPREMMGLVPFLTTLSDDPDLVREMIDDRADFYIALYEKAIAETRPDFAFIWEDMCFKNGPLLSPAMFRSFLLPAYRKLTGFLRDMGVDIIIVDSDGDVTRLVPLWMEGGVTAILPFEVRAGMDVVSFGRQFPSLQILGGIDKHEIAKGKAAIDAELRRVLPAMLQRGGYCVALDHWVPPQISLADFTHYVERVREFRPK
jgi:uroporphyrinogen decarboxylase